MKEYRVATIRVDGSAHTLADKLTEMSKGGWDIEGMDVIGIDRNKMLIVASKESNDAD